MLIFVRRKAPCTPVTYGATSARGGVGVSSPQDWLRVYASYGQGFQTPLARSWLIAPTQVPGLNPDCSRPVATTPSLA